VRVSNPYFHPNRDGSENLEIFISNVKNDVTKMLNTPSYHKSNLTIEERSALRNLKENENLIINSADKGGRVVIMDKSDYVEACNKLLHDKKFYETVESDPTERVCEEIQTLLEGMDKKGYFSKNESTFIFEDLGCPRMPVFYGLPKIHKLYQHFPPLRPIVSQIKSSTYNVSRYIDSFLKYQAQKCESYIRDTKDFLNKLKSIDKLPENSVLVTMDVASLYTNISHKEGAQACFEKLETRTKKRVPSGVLKQLIILVLSNNVFKFGDKIYRRIKGTAMGTPMAPNYANLFMDKFEREMLCDFEKQYGFRPFVWYRYIDDIFFVWTAGEESLTCFIQFVQNYSTAQNMESTMKFEVNISSLMVNFLDVKVYLRNGYLQTTLFTKPTDAHIYLNASSNHPSHVIKNLPKGQFIRVRRICSEKAEYFSHARQMLQYFLLRGYSESILKKTLQEVSCISRDELLMDKPSSAPKDPQVIYVSEYHPALKQLPTILKRHHHVLKNDKKLYKHFPEPPTVGFVDVRVFTIT